MRTPYRVIVWGPGAVGRACLRTLVKRDDCQIVGVLAYSADKNGKDVGELIDHVPIGVKVTTDKEVIFALEADVVLYAGMLPFDAPTHDSDIIRLLESSKNVVSAVAFHYAHNHEAGGVLVEAKVGDDNGAEELKKISGVRDVTSESEGDWKIFSLRVESGVDVRAEIFQLAAARHWTVRELSQRRATLEDVFVEITHPDEV